MRLKQKLDTLLPSYTRIPLILALCVNTLAYSVTRLYTQNLVHYNFSLPIDAVLPFVPAFSVIYVLAYIQWATGYILIVRESREFCYRLMSGEIISKLICLALFLIVPTTMVRADITSDDFFSTFVKFIYQVDAPDNLFPSIHCFSSWFCFRGVMKTQKTAKWYKYFNFIFSLLVFASTVLIKQHVVVDIIAGIVVYELGQYISKKTNFASVLKRLNHASFKRK